MHLLQNHKIYLPELCKTEDMEMSWRKCNNVFFMLLQLISIPMPPWAFSVSHTYCEVLLATKHIVKCCGDQLYETVWCNVTK